MRSKSRSDPTLALWRTDWRAARDRLHASGARIVAADPGGHRRLREARWRTTEGHEFLLRDDRFCDTVVTVGLPKEAGSSVGLDACVHDLGALLQRAQAPDDEVAAVLAIAAIARPEDPGVREVLTAAAASPRAEVRAAFLRAVARLQTGLYTAEVMRMAHEDPDEGIRADAGNLARLLREYASHLR